MTAYPTRAAAALQNLSAVAGVTIERWDATSPFVPATYVKTSAEPLHSAKFQSADGYWFELDVEKRPDARLLGAMGDGVTNDTAAIARAIEFRGGAHLVKDHEFILDVTGADLRLLRGPGLIRLSTGSVVVADALVDRGGLAQRYFTEVKTTGNNSVTQSIAVHDGKLYRCQQNTVSGNMYAYDTTSDVSEFDLPPGDGRSRSTIDYTSDSGAQISNYKATIKGLGHGDGIAFLTEGGQTWLYGHCSAPPGSSDPEAEANGYVKFPWLGASTALEPVGAVFYRDLQYISNPNFGLSADGKWLLFVQRDVDSSGILTAGNGSVTTYRVVVYNRDAVESAVDHTQVPPFAKFVVVPHALTDTIYAQAGITSDGKYIYITFSGARVVGKTWLYIYTLTGDFIKAICTSGIRAENVDVYSEGKSGWLPAFYETEGLTVHEDKVLTASRYLFSSGSDIVTWRGENYVYMGTNPSAGNLPTNVAYWAPTNAAATSGAYNPATTYQRGTVVFHHYITAYVTDGVYGSEEFAIDVDPYNHPYVENSFNGMVSSRTDYSIAYYPLNSRKVYPISTNMLTGEHLFYNAVNQANGQETQTQGAKLWFNGSDIRLQHIEGLENSAAIILSNSADGSTPNNVKFYVGGGTLGARFAAAGGIFYGYVRGATNGSYDLGTSSIRWRTGYFVNAPNVSSDERLKKFIEQFEKVTEDDLKQRRTAERSAALEIGRNIRTYKLNSEIEETGEDGALWHFGVGAQSVSCVMKKHGLEPEEYSFFRHSIHGATDEVWDEWPATLDPDGNLLQPAGRSLVEGAQEAGEIYSICYEELLSFITDAVINYVDQALERMEVRLSDVESRISI